MLQDWEWRERQKYLTDQQMVDNFKILKTIGEELQYM